MRLRRATLAAVGAACAVATGSAAQATGPPPAPVLASHGREVHAARVDYCPRPERRPCHLVDEFRRTQPLIFHPDGLLSIRLPRSARRLRLDLDCRQSDPARAGPRRWTVVTLGSRCSEGILDLFYEREGKRPLRVRYTFNLRNHGHCERDESATHAENDLVRIYSHWSGDDYNPYYAENEFFACRLDSGSKQRLGRDFCGDADDGCEFIQNLAVAGERVAYVTGHVGGRFAPDRRSSLMVLNTATWQIEREIIEQERQPATRRQFTAVAVKANGSIAWILDKEDYTGTGPNYYTQTYEVWKAGSGGRTRLDSSPDILPYSLTLSGSVLQWRYENGEVRAATLD